MCKINSGGDGVESAAMHIPSLQADDHRIVADLAQGVLQRIEPDATLIVCWYHDAAGFTETEESQRDIDRLVAFFADDYCHFGCAAEPVLLDVPARPA